MNEQDDFGHMIIEGVKLLAMQVDYDQLCADRVLEQVTKNKYKVLDMKRLPKHARLRIQELHHTATHREGEDRENELIVTFGNTVESASKLLAVLNEKGYT